MIERLPAERALRICAVGNLDGIHTHSWLEYFVERGHDVHGISYYVPSRPPQGVTVHALRPSQQGKGSFPGRTRPGLAQSARRIVPPSVERLANLVRFRRAGLRRAVEQIAPDVLHGHFLVEHGFYATSAALHPYIVSAWGSDVLVEPRSFANRQIARFTASRADLVTANNRHMAREIVLKLGKERAWVQHIVLGVSQSFLDGAPPSVNARQAAGSPSDAMPPTVISTRSLDTPLYNIDVILRSFSRARARVPNARLIVAGDGRLRPELESLARELRLDDAASFVGSLEEPAFRDALARSHVFVSTPASDATSVALLQAMGAGAFPIVSDLPSQQELVENGVQGLRVAVRHETALAEAIVRALDDGELRRSAVERNRAFVEEYGVTEKNMAKMEAWYYRLAGRADEWTPPESM
jgi:glycosyltransferase involved in cell wall biosynthesis